jgi:hypothetical protein
MRQRLETPIAEASHPLPNSFHDGFFKGPNRGALTRHLITSESDPIQSRVGSQAFSPLAMLLKQSAAVMLIAPKATKSEVGANDLSVSVESLDRPVKVALATGERQRDRVLNKSEVKDYLCACPQPWKDCATIILDEGFRPSETFALPWSHVFFNTDDTGLVQVTEGKSKAAHRMLPMTSRVCELLRNRHESCGRPSEGWISRVLANVGTSTAMQRKTSTRKP